jgi:hypothetical protein
VDLSDRGTGAGRPRPGRRGGTAAAAADEERPGPQLGPSQPGHRATPRRCSTWVATACSVKYAVGSPKPVPTGRLMASFVQQPRQHEHGRWAGPARGAGAATAGTRPGSSPRTRCSTGNSRTRAGSGWPAGRGTAGAPGKPARRSPPLTTIGQTTVEGREQDRDRRATRPGPGAADPPLPAGATRRAPRGGRRLPLADDAGASRSASAAGGERARCARRARSTRNSASDPAGGSGPRATPDRLHDHVDHQDDDERDHLSSIY